MAKTYIDIVKYVVEANFEISGAVEKPDIIGAIFGQTEGLLGGDLDLRELQKNGKIGRIEIESASSGGKTRGKLYLPSSIGRVETCVLGAAIESVDRVGPYETVFKVEKIGDTRSEKRKKIIDRAKELVKSMLNTEIPDSKEISDLVESDVKSSIVGVYGQDKLPAGPDIDKSDDVIMVEGRADVINLLRNDITSCIAVGGASGSVPKTIIGLCSKKDTTLFVDGDRGGDMIAKSIINVAEVDYVAKAPDGKEVEELTRKEIIKALRSKIPVEQYMHGNHNSSSQERRPPQEQRQQGRYGGRPQQRREFQREREDQALSPSQIINNMTGTHREQRSDAIPEEREEIKEVFEESGESHDTQEHQNQESTQFPEERFLSALNDMKNTLRGRLYGSDGSMIAEVPIREMIQSMQDSEGIGAVVFDGIITQRLIDLASKRGVKYIYGMRASQISRIAQGMKLYTVESGAIEGQ
jgi:DNA primase